MEDKIQTSTQTKLGCSIAAVVFLLGIILLSVYACVNDRYDHRQFITQSTITELQKIVEEHREKTGSLPKSLDQFRGNRELCSVSDEAGKVTDQWGRPFVYQVEGDAFTITSLGCDGKPGGVGVNFDISSIDPDPEESEPTLGQTILEYLNGQLYIGIIWMAVFSLPAFLLGFMLVKPLALIFRVKPEVLQAEGAPGLRSRILLTIVGAIIVAPIIALLQKTLDH